MKRPDWRKATRNQLYNIAFHDEEAPLIYKEAAKEEIRRRNQQKKKHGRVNYREKARYGR